MKKYPKNQCRYYNSIIQLTVFVTVIVGPFNEEVVSSIYDNHSIQTDCGTMNCISQLN